LKNQDLRPMRRQANNSEICSILSLIAARLGIVAFCC